MLEHLYIETTTAPQPVTLHVVRAGDPANPPVILLHGFPEFWYGWRRQIAALAAAGFCVYAPDQRGYNLSEKPTRRDDYALPNLSGDVVALIDHLGVDKVYLAGHDWGAAVSWWTAVTAPERIAKLAILNVPHLSVMMKHIAGNPRQMLKSWYIGFFQIPFLPELAFTVGEGMGMASTLLRTSRPGSFTDADIAEYAKAWRQPGAATGMLNWYRSMVQNQPRLPPGVTPRVHVPTLMLWGRDDVALTAEMAEESLTYCDDARLIMYDDATHWVQHDKADEVSRELIAWFSS